MLTLLTGDIQTGKTRWLQARVAELTASGTEVWGVLAPGVWVPREASKARVPGSGEGDFEKLGIEMVCYPAGKRLTFARRADLADGSVEAMGDARMRSMWRFSPEAIQAANGLFADMRARRDEEPPAGGRVAVIDEIGRLELAGRGMTQAVAFLDDGPSRAFPQVIAVVRTELLEAAAARFAPAWGDELQVLHASAADETTASFGA